MKNIFIVSVLVLGLSFPLTSQAEDSVFGVTIPVSREYVSDHLRGGYVAQSSSDTLVVQKLHKSGGLDAKPQTNESLKDSYAVFGVRVPVNQDI